MESDPEFPDEIFGFHVQQTTEKSAKAILAAKGIAFERTHDLELLFEKLHYSNCIVDNEFSELLDMTDFAVQYRYQAFDDLGAGLGKN